MLLFRHMLLMLLCERIGSCCCSCGWEYWSLCVHRFSTLCACIADVDTIRPMSSIVRLAHVNIVRRASKVHDQVVSNNIPIRWLRLVNDPWSNNVGFVIACSPNVLTTVAPLIIKWHISMMRPFRRSDSRRSNHHIVNLKVISQACADWHCLVERINELLPGVPSPTISRMSSINWTLLDVLGLIEGYRLNGFFQCQRPFVPLVNQMISCGYVIMAVSLETLHWVIRFEIIFLNYLSEQIVIIRHLLETWVETWFSIGWRGNLFEPRVLPYRCDSRSFFWVSVENFCKEIPPFIGHKFGYLVISTQDFLIKLRSFRIFKRQVAAYHGI